MSAYCVSSRIPFAVALAALSAFPAFAVTRTATTQSEFEAAVLAATQPGANDTIEVNAVSVASPALMLPGQATALTINFNGAPPSSANNPIFNVGFGNTGTLDFGANTTLHFDATNGVARFNVGRSDGGVGGVGTVNMTGGTVSVTPGSNYLALDVGRGTTDSVGVFNQSGGSVLMSGGAFQIGVVGGQGTYTMSNDAIVDMAGGTVYIGDGAGGNGKLYIHNDAKFTIGTPSGGQFYLGNDQGTGTVYQDGAGSLVDSAAPNGINLGSAVNLPTGVGGVGEYNLSQGQLRLHGTANTGLNLGVDDQGKGTFNQTGGLVKLEDSAQIRFGAGTGIYNLNGGTLQVNVANPFTFNGAGTHDFNLGGGTIEALTGFSTTMDFDLTGGVSTIDTLANNVSMAGVIDGPGALKKAGDGTLTLNAANTYTGGTWVSDGTLLLGAAGSLASTGEMKVDAGATFDLNNKTQAVGSLSGAGTVKIGTGILVAGGDNVDSAFSGNVDMTGQSYQNPHGVFAKIGTGTMTIDGAEFQYGETHVLQGKIAQTSDDTRVAYLAVGTGKTGSDPNVGGLDVSGGTLTIGTALQVGDFGGVGTVNQTGGQVIVTPECGIAASCASMNIGNQGGTGTYNVSGGSLNLNGGLNTIGRASGNNAASNGTLNISDDGLVVVKAGAFGGGSLIVGSRDHRNAAAGAADEGRGTIHQTGGTLRVENGSTLFLSAYGNGTYDLLGGTLQAGGNSIVNNWNNHGGTYAFNLGGGTIQAYGTALTVNANATLLADTLSTIDSNGLGVTYNGILSGDGALKKAGDGTLALTAASTFMGGTWVSDGTLFLGVGATLASGGDLQVDAGAKLDLNNNNQIVGDFSGGGEVALGTAKLTTDSDNNTEFSGSITGTGSFAKYGNGTLLLSGESTYGGPTDVNGGKLVVNGTLASDVFVNAGTLAGNGTVGGLLIAGGATLSPGNSIGTMHVSGDVTFNAGSFYQVEVGDGLSDNTAATGTATLHGGTVVVTQTGILSTASPYTIVSSSGLSGTFDAVAGSFVFLTPDLEYDDYNAYLTFSRNGTSFVDIAETANQRSVAGALDQFPAANELFSILLSSGSINDVRTAFDALSGEIYASVPSALAEQSRFIRGAIFDRLHQAASGGPIGSVLTFSLASAGTAMDGRMALGAVGRGKRAAPKSSSDLVFWTQGYGSWGEFDGGGAAKVDRSIGGFVSGVDANMGGGWRGGLATGYSRTDLSADARASSADADSYLLAAYAGGDLGPLAVSTGAAWSWHSIDASRVVAFPGLFEREQASYGADTGQLFAELTYPILRGSTKVESFGGLAWVHMSTDSFSESGGIATLTVDDSNEDIGYSTLGGRWSTTTRIAGTLVTPRASAAWQHAFGSTTADMALGFSSTGIGFGVNGVPIAEDSALLEAGLDVVLGPESKLGASYVGQLSKDVQDHGFQGYVSVRY